MHLLCQTDLALAMRYPRRWPHLFWLAGFLLEIQFIRRRQPLDSHVRLLTQVAAAHRLLATFSGTDSRRSIFRSRLNIA
jgi:hypothetical protein